MKAFYPAGNMVARVDEKASNYVEAVLPDGSRLAISREKELTKKELDRALYRKLKEITGLNLSYADYFKIHDRPEVEDILEEMIQDISAGLVSIINMLQPEMIVLGYDGIDWPEDYVKKLEVLINDRKIAQDGWNIPVKKAYFGKQAQLVGAAALVVNSIFKGELQFFV